MERNHSLEYSGVSSVGVIRTNNEDSFYVNKIWDDNTVIAIVADGLGGCQKGEIASKLAVDTIVSYLSKYSNGDRLELLRQAVIAANNTIIEKQAEIPDANNMSTVITIAIFDPIARLVYMAHVGDTRLYVFTNERKLVKLSHDHTLVGYKEELGELTEEEAMSHPKRNEISKVLGMSLIDINSKGFVELSSFELYSKSTYLLCSDGLYDMITSQEISNVLRDKNSLKEKQKKLVEYANKAGGKDNITVVLIENKSEWNDVNNFTDVSTSNKIEESSYIHQKQSVFQPLKLFFFLLIGAIIGATIFYLYDKAYNKENYNNTNHIDIVYMNCMPDSTINLRKKQDSIIHQLEINIMLLKSTIENIDSNNGKHLVNHVANFGT